MPTYLLSVHTGAEPRASHEQTDDDPAAMQAMMQPILDLDEALDWARRVTDCVGRPIEVRPFAATGRARDQFS